MGYLRMFGWTKSSRRKKLVEQAVSSQEFECLRHSVWQAARLSLDDQSQLARWTRVFISEKHWEGCDGLKLTDEMKQAVASAAGLMVLRYPDWYFDHTTSIVMHRRPYIAKVNPKYQNTGMGGEYARAGETIYRGPVVLNWQDIVRASKHHHHGHHLVIHEFAHQLDMINGPRADGLPPLPNEVNEQAWRDAMHAEYEAARSMIAEGHQILMDDYGLTEEGEFFAVASELYFQTPNELAQYHPNVFELLKQFYKIDLR